MFNKLNTFMLFNHDACASAIHRAVGNLSIEQRRYDNLNAKIN